MSFERRMYLHKNMAQGFSFYSKKKVKKGYSISFHRPLKNIFMIHFMSFLVYSATFMQSWRSKNNEHSRSFLVVSPLTAVHEHHEGLA